MLNSIQILTLAALFCLIPTVANAQTEIESIEALLSGEQMKGANLGFSLKPMGREGNPLSYREDQFLVPASSIKLVTTLTALRFFGQDHCFYNRLILDGELADHGVWLGDLIVETEGDPTFFSPRFGIDHNQLLNDWILALSELGVQGIKGRLMVLDEYFEGYPIASGVVNEDAGNYYGGGAFGFNCFDNTYDLEFSTLGKDAQFEVYRGIDPTLTFECQVGINSKGKDLAYVMGMPYSSERQVKGSLPARAKTIQIKGAYPDPAKAFAHYLYSYIGKHGIKCVVEVSSERESVLRRPRLVAESCSPVLGDIITETNLGSVNLYADALFRHCGKYLGGNGEYEDAGTRIAEYWDQQGVNSWGIELEDGSGLSRSTLVSAEFIANILSNASVEERDNLIKGLKTMEGRGKQLYYKTGYMSGVMAVAGFLKDEQGQWSSFSMIANGHHESPAVLRKNMLRAILQVN